jgi:hypothetical protein
VPYITVGISRMTVHVYMHMLMVDIHRIWCPWIVVVRIVTPVVRRIPWAVARAPQIHIHHGRLYVVGLNHIIWTVHIHIAHHLNACGAGVIALHIYCGNVLKHILAYYCLYHNEMCAAFGRFYHTEIVYKTICVEVEVADLKFWVVEFSLEVV